MLPTAALVLAPGLLHRTGRAVLPRPGGDRIGRRRAYQVNGLLSVACLIALPSIVQSGNVVLLFLAVGVVGQRRERAEQSV